MWALFDISQLKLARTNFNISFEGALLHNLMGVLAGDVSYVLQPDASVNFVFTKEELLSSEEAVGGSMETWRIRVSDAFITDGAGTRRSDLHNETFQLLGTWPLEESEVHHKDAIEKRFYVSGDTAQFAHQALVRLLHWERSADDQLDWRGLLRATEITKSIADFRAALRRGLDEKMVRYVLDQHPVEMPKFIDRPKLEPSDV